MAVEEEEVLDMAFQYFDVDGSEAITRHEFEGKAWDLAHQPTGRYAREEKPTV